MTKKCRGLLSLLLVVVLFVGNTATSFAEIAASHIYHNHMPNFWAYYDVTQYDKTAVGAPVRYMYDGQVLNLKQNPPPNYTYFMQNGRPMPHDDLVTYYSHHAKRGAYLDWPWSGAYDLNKNHPSSQRHVTMSAAVINNVNSFAELGNLEGYGNKAWGTSWKTAFNTLKTPKGNRTLDMLNFTGHHSMGPLVGNEYFLKDLIYERATLAQPYFLGDSFVASKGIFPTELGFSERLIPVLAKLGIEWSAIGNNHFSRTLLDYPYLNDPGKDTMVSPPNRADMQNKSDVGKWVSQPMFNEQQVVQNKFPFAATPAWVRYVDPETGKEDRIVGMPIAQAESWEEGYQGSVTASQIKPFDGLTPNKLFFGIAHDGDNSSGRAGDGGTYANAGNVTYSDSGVKGMGIDDYLASHKPANDYVVKIQDGSWIDTRDSSSDPQWHHWKLPFCVWKGQFPLLNAAYGTNYDHKVNYAGAKEQMTVSFEYGYHYLERNFALLQPALNYAKTAEQIWLDDNPNYWSPKTALDKQVTYEGNQLNPWMLSYPIKGDKSKNYAGGANPAELGWYFLLPALDSGFGYYTENETDHVKPTIAFNQSLYFSEPYVKENLAKDKTGPSVWWPQRWPYNPGSANQDKSQGWTLHYYDNNFAVYTYAFDVNDIKDIKVKIRTHNNVKWSTKDTNWISATDNTFRVYDPAALKAKGVPNIDPSKVSEWKSHSMNKRNLTPDINGVPWQTGNIPDRMKIVPAQKIGDLYYSYIGDYRDQMLDYYIEAVDSKGNVTKTQIQTVYVGTGRYKNEGGKLIEDINGTIEGTYPFVTNDKQQNKKMKVYLQGNSTMEFSVKGKDGVWSEPKDTSVSSYAGYQEVDVTFDPEMTDVSLRYRAKGSTTWTPSDSGVVLNGDKTWTIPSSGTTKEGAPQFPVIVAAPAGGEFKTDTLSITLNVDKATGGKYTLDGSDPANGKTFTNGEIITIGADMNFDATKTLKVYAQNEEGPMSAQYTYTKKDPNAGITVYFKKPSNWGPPNIYAYQGDGATAKAHTVWPGTPMKSLGNDWFSYTIEGWTDFKVIFNGSGNQIPAASEPGMKVTKDAWYYTDKKWYPENPEKPQNIPVTGVTLSPVTLNIAKGSSQVLTATVAPSDATNKAVTWTSSNPAVASVDANGKVTAVSEGQAVITVTTVDGNKTATTTVTVPTVEVPFDTTVKNLKIGVATENTISLQWEAPDHNKKVVSYKITRSKTGAEPVVATTNATSYEDKNLLPGTTYTYEVIAIDETGKASKPASIQGITLMNSTLLNVKVGSATGTLGREVEVPIHLENIEQRGVSAFDLWLEFDSSILEYNGVTGKIAPEVYVVGNQIRMNYYNVQSFQDGENLITLKFNVKGTGTTDIKVLKDFGQDYVLGFYDVLESPYTKVETYDGKLSLTGNEIQLGDVDGDGSLTSADALETIFYSLGKRQPTDIQKAKADVNKDGKINAQDALRIIRAVFGLVQL